MIQGAHRCIPLLEIILLLLLCDNAIAFYPGAGLRPTRISSKTSSPIFFTRRHCPVSRSITILQGASNNSTTDPREIITTDESGAFLAGDLVAVIVACQMIGLVDAINDASFLDHGGWAQPLPPVPSTLGLFVQRTCTGCITWIAATLLPSTMVIPNETKSTAPRTTRMIVSTVRSILLFISLQLGLAFGISLASSGGSVGVSGSFDPILVSRDCYYIVIVISGWRYLSTKLWS